MEKVTKLLFCTDGVFPHSIGGMQKHSLLLIEELAKHRDIRITVVHPHEFRVFTNPSIEEIQIRPINKDKNYLLECYKYSREVYNIIRERHDHIVYSQGLSVWYKISRITNPLIVNPHGLEPFQAIGFKNRLLAVPFKAIFKYIFKHASIIISLGGKLTSILQANVKDENKIRVIPNAVNISKTARKNIDCDGPVKALFVGRFASNKGIDILLNAIRKLNEQGRGKDFLFNLVGSGPLYETYSTGNLPENVKMPGRLEDHEIKKLYIESDVFILPTLFEGMPTVVLEAMSYHLPVIVTNVGATSILVNYSNGKLIEPKNEIEIVESLIWFKSLHPEERAKMGEASFKKASSLFTWEVVGKTHSELFKTLSGN